MYPHVEESDRWCNIYLYIVNLADLIDQQSLKETLHRIVPQKQEEVKEFRKQHGNAKLGEYTIDQVRNVAMHVQIHTINRAEIIAMDY